MTWTRASSDAPVRRPIVLTSRETSRRASSTSKKIPPSSMVKKIVPNRGESADWVIAASKAKWTRDAMRPLPPHRARRSLRELQGAVALVGGRRRELHDHDVRHHHRVLAVVGDR